MARILLLACLFLPLPVMAHMEGPDEHHEHAQPAPTIGDRVTNWLTSWQGLIRNAEAADSVSITIENGYRVIRADGIPQHHTGNFPNPGNPNRIQPQHHVYRVTLTPTRTGRVITRELSPFGVAVNGVPFDPGAAEFWHNDRQSGWQYEALSGAINLGVDRNNAHVQRNGTYHYHGMPVGLLERLGAGNLPMLLGYAADGFPIYGPTGYRQANNPASGTVRLISSYLIRTGYRTSGPGGQYDGSFVRDYQYRPGSGDLDECNGREGVTPEYPNGTYYYVITDRFPFIPRCFKGTPDPSFRHVPGNGRRMGEPTNRGPEGNPPMTGRSRGGPPAEAIRACTGKREGDTASFTTPRGHTLQGTCRTLNGQLAVVPTQGRRP